MSSTTIPEWVRNLVDEHGGSDPWFIMTKTLKSSDLNLRDQNRLLIPSRDVKVNLIPMLSENEKAEASLLHPTSRRNMPSTSRVQGREHRGLDVDMYSQNRIRWHLKLTCWVSTGSTVMKGKEYKGLMLFSSLRVNDKVDLWGFRHGEEGRLCFALDKKTE